MPVVLKTEDASTAADSCNCPTREMNTMATVCTPKPDTRKMMLGAARLSTLQARIVLASRMRKSRGNAQSMATASTWHAGGHRDASPQGIIMACHRVALRMEALTRLASPI